MTHSWQVKILAKNEWTPTECLTKREQFLFQKPLEGDIHTLVLVRGKIEAYRGGDRLGM